MARKRHISVIAKPTHDCNLRCSYCYIDDNAENGKMDSTLLEESIKKVSDYASHSSWIWHGGEPLLMGEDFYRQIVDVQSFYRKKGRSFSNSIQTNGTLLDDDMIDFLKSAKFGVGMSLDGPKYLNDTTRIFRSGQGGFDRIYEGVKKVQESQGSVGVICVVNKNNIGCVDELYDFFKGEKINVKFNPLIKSGRFYENVDNLSISPSEYGGFLSSMWDIYNNDCKSSGAVPIDIDPFVQVIGNMVTGDSLGCNYAKGCRDSFVSIGPRGDIYPCGRFDGIPEFWMGNVSSNSIGEAMESSVNSRLRSRGLESVAGCGDCKSKKVCNSGCMHNAYSAGDVMGRDPYCESYKSLFSSVSKELDIEGLNYDG